MLVNTQMHNCRTSISDEILFAEGLVAGGEGLKPHDTQFPVEEFIQSNRFCGNFSALPAFSLAIVSELKLYMLFKVLISREVLKSN